ncbi:hypothetical protein KGM_204661 [Danaus plexippus plexippus]|uniref:Uncharacterized protein n=1 Tax=Danaus plexippus plexippus TaxID=278856 RepID=A0A212FFY0_DANPL|nr:hypothetical protein KGM_204661 [Danaus plexippus plexippus]
MQRPYKRRFLRPNNMHEAFYGDFEYVVTKKKPPRICFGTGLDREVLPMKGPALSPFMRRMAHELRPNLGPGSYNDNRDAFYDINHRIKCVPYNLDACGFCGCSCSEQGDYWHYENRIFLCRKHYSILFKHCLAKFQGVKLAEFKSVRDCFFAHAHNSCKAALKIMKSEEIEKKLRKEAYLDLFFPQRRFCNN